MTLKWIFRQNTDKSVDLQQKKYHQKDQDASIQRVKIIFFHNFGQKVKLLHLRRFKHVQFVAALILKIWLFVKYRQNQPIKW